MVSGASPLAKRLPSPDEDLGSTNIRPSPFPKRLPSPDHEKATVASSTTEDSTEDSQKKQPDREHAHTHTRARTHAGKKLKEEAGWLTGFAGFMHARRKTVPATFFLRNKSVVRDRAGRIATRFSAVRGALLRTLD